MVFVVHGFDSILTRDLALYAYGGQQVAEGVPPYVGVLNRAGPLAHLVPGARRGRGAASSAIDDLLGMRVLMLLLSVACVWVLYLLARDLFDSRLAGVASATALLDLPGFVTYATGGPREKTTMMLLRAPGALGGAEAALAAGGRLRRPRDAHLAAVVLPGAVRGRGRDRRAGPTGDAAGALVRFAVGGLIPTALITAGLRPGRRADGVPGRLRPDQPALHHQPGRLYDFDERVGPALRGVRRRRSW